MTVTGVFDPLLDPLLDGDPDESEIAERMAAYDAYMGLFETELDRVLFRHGFSVTVDELRRVKWVLVRFMQEAGTSDLDALEATFLEKFVPREHGLRLLDQELDWVLARHEGSVSPAERAAVRTAVVEHFDANVTLGLADLERVYVAEVVPDRILDRHLGDLAAFFASRSGEDRTWDDFAAWSEEALAAVVDAHTEHTGVRALRLQAMHVPAEHVASLLDWACRPGVTLHGAAGLRLLVGLRGDGDRSRVVEAFRFLDRFWKILLVRSPAPERDYWRGILRESARL